MDNYVLTKNNVMTKVEAGDWSEAIRIVGHLLEKAGSITSNYTDAMINAVNELGPYMVILPNFALAHAAPSEDVLKNDAALITLKEPVLFGSPNDPVYIILAICSKDGKSHIGLLTDIANIFMEENTIPTIIRAENVEEIMKIFDRHSS